MPRKSRIPAFFARTAKRPESPPRLGDFCYFHYFQNYDSWLFLPTPETSITGGNHWFPQIPPKLPPDPPPSRKLTYESHFAKSSESATQESPRAFLPHWEYVLRCTDEHTDKRGESADRSFLGGIPMIMTPRIIPTPRGSPPGPPLAGTGGGASCLKNIVFSPPGSAASPVLRQRKMADRKVRVPPCFGILGG